MSEGIRKIGHPSQLAGLAGWQLTSSHTREQIQLDAPTASRQKVRAWEAQLTRHQSPCGCEQGAAGLVVGVAGSLIYFLLRPGGWGDPGWREFWIGLAVVLVTTSVGKLFGVLWGQRKLRRITQEIQSEWKPQRPPVREFGPVTISKTGARPMTRCCGNR